MVALRVPFLRALPASQFPLIKGIAQRKSASRRGGSRLTSSTVKFPIQLLYRTLQIIGQIKRLLKRVDEELALGQP